MDQLGASGTVWMTLGGLWLLLLWGFCAGIAAEAAQRQRRSRAAWGLAGLFFGPFALLALSAYGVAGPEPVAAKASEDDRPLLEAPAGRPIVLASAALTFVLVSIFYAMYRMHTAPVGVANAAPPQVGTEQPELPAVGAGASTEGAGASPVAPRWFSVEGVSPADGKAEAFAVVESASGYFDPSGFKRHPELHLVCKANKTQLYVDAEYPLQTTSAAKGEALPDVKVRLDDGAVQKLQVTRSALGDGFSIPKPVVLIKQMRESKTLHVAFTPYGGQPVDAAFDLAGIEEHAAVVGQACGW